MDTVPAPAPSVSAAERHPDRPVVILGAGPAGLAAAEAGASAGAAVSQGGPVRLFSPWSELTDPVAEKPLTANGFRRRRQ